MLNDTYPRKLLQPESEWAYMSKSQFNSWQKCEAATLAELEGTYTRPASNALAVGSYVDAALDGPEAFAQFVKKTETSLLSLLRLNFKETKVQRVEVTFIHLCCWEESFSLLYFKKMSF